MTFSRSIVSLGLVGSLAACGGPIPVDGTSAIATASESECDSGTSPVHVDPAAIDESIDAYRLQRSLEQLESLRVVRDGTTVLMQSRAGIEPYLPYYASSISAQTFIVRWEQTLAAWMGANDAADFADAHTILAALASQFVGVREVSVGPSCSPISTGYVYGFVAAGVPGDDVPDRLRAEIERSEAEIVGIEANNATACHTLVEPQGAITPVNVTIDLGASASGTASIWALDGHGSAVRAGVPVP